MPGPPVFPFKMIFFYLSAPDRAQPPFLQSAFPPCYNRGESDPEGDITMAKDKDKGKEKLNKPKLSIKDKKKKKKEKQERKQAGL